MNMIQIAILGLLFITFRTSGSNPPTPPNNPPCQITDTCGPPPSPCSLDPDAC